MFNIKLNQENIKFSDRKDLHLQKNKMILKATVLLLCLAINFLFAQDKMKNNYITIQSKNKPLREVLRNITDQTKVKFVYSDDLVKDRKISCNLEKMSLEEVLSDILKNTDISYTKISNENLITLHKKPQVKNSDKSLAQNKCRIRGTVKDLSTGKPLNYVNVFIANTTLGDVSDDAGNYIIPNVPLGSYELIASMMGYEIQKKVLRAFDSSTRTINFELKPRVLQREEIRVTAKYPKEWKKN